MSDPNLAGLIQEIGTGFEAFKAANELRLKELEGGGSPDVVLTEKVERMATDLAEMASQKAKLEKLQEQLDSIEAKAANPLNGAAAEQPEDVREFAKGMRTKAGYAALEQKAVDADFGTNSTAGGVAIPEVIASQILAKLIDLSPFRSLVRVTPVSSPNYERLIDVKGTASGWAAEGTTRSETGTAALQRVTFTHGELYAVPKASQWALNDIMFDVTGWLTQSVAEEFALQEGIAIATGNGTNKPTGFLNGTPVATTDEASPARAFGVLEYLPTGAAASFQLDRLGSPPGTPDEVFMDCAFALKAGYRQNARWVLNKATVATIMKLHDADGRTLWNPGLAFGTPDTILRFPVVEMEAMPALGANTFPIAFGDFNAAYELLDITGMSMIRDDVTAKGQVLFYVARRLGGKLVNDDAIKLIKCATS